MQGWARAGPAPQRHSPWPRLSTEARTSYTVLWSCVWIVFPMLLWTPGERRAVCRAGPQETRGLPSQPSSSPGFRRVVLRQSGRRAPQLDPIPASARVFPGGARDEGMRGLPKAGLSWNPHHSVPPRLAPEEGKTAVPRPAAPRQTQGREAAPSCPRTPRLLALPQPLFPHYTPQLGVCPENTMGAVMDYRDSPAGGSRVRAGRGTLSNAQAMHEFAGPTLLCPAHGWRSWGHVRGYLALTWGTSETRPRRLSRVSGRALALGPICSCVRWLVTKAVTTPILQGWGKSKGLAGCLWTPWNSAHASRLTWAPLTAVRGWSAAGRP